MSLARLLLATRDRLRDKLTLMDSECDVTYDERPFPTSGNLFISIVGDGWEPGEFDSGVALDEVYGLTCTVSLRKSGVPRDRIGTNIYLAASLSLEDICRKIMVNIDKSPSLISEANDGMDGANEITEYLRWSGTDPRPRVEGSDWYDAPGDIPDAAYVMSVRFGGARRIQVTSGAV